jgi:hypothetical protein
MELLKQHSFSHFGVTKALLRVLEDRAQSLTTEKARSPRVKVKIERLAGAK